MSTPNREMNPSARKRSKNYTAEEEVLLVELVDGHKNCIENKKSDAVIWKQKEEAWRKIEKEFAATIGTHRHWKALRDKYEMIKRKSKSEMAEQKLETYRTGGGVVSTKVSSVSEKIASMLGDTATGLQNIYDSDSLNVLDSINYADQEICIENVDQKQTSSGNFGEEIVVESKSDWSSWRPTTLKQKKSKELVVGAKRKRNLEDEKIELTVLQQKYYRDENTRAQKKYEEELISLKLKNEILQLELAEKKAKML